MDGAAMVSWPILTSPQIVGLEIEGRGNTPPSRARVLVDERWASITEAVADRRAGDAIEALVALARAMYEVTETPHNPHRNSETASRQILYDDIALVGQFVDSAATARHALDQCRTWDRVLGEHLLRLAQSIEDTDSHDGLR